MSFEQFLRDNSERQIIARVLQVDAPREPFWDITLLTTCAGDIATSPDKPSALLVHYMINRGFDLVLGGHAAGPTLVHLDDAVEWAVEHFGKFDIPELLEEVAVVCVARSGNVTSKLPPSLPRMLVCLAHAQGLIGGRTPWHIGGQAGGHSSWILMQNRLAGLLKELAPIPRVHC